MWRRIGVINVRREEAQNGISHGVAAASGVKAGRSA